MSIIPSGSRNVNVGSIDDSVVLNTNLSSVDGEVTLTTELASGSVIDSRNYIWNTSSLAWEKATGSAGAGSVTVTNFPATYPSTQSGSWTVTANAGTNLNTSALATSANQETANTGIDSIDNKLQVTGEGHLEVAIHAPRLPFGSVHVENLTPVFQSDAVYGINSLLVVGGSSGSGIFSSSNSTFYVETGTTVYSFANLQSRKRLRYRPGQGVVGRFTAMFTTPVASSYQVAGLGHAEDGVYFGYKDTTFGILYNNRGVREVQTLTVTAGSNTNETMTVTLAGVANGVAVTNSGSTLRTAYEISQGNFVGWKAECIGSTVIFLADSVGDKTGTFSITATTATGSFVETKTGVAATESFIPQASWNCDPLDGNGPSGMTLDPTKFNVYQIGLQYLGAGVITLEVEAPLTAPNNAEWVIVHQIKIPNSQTITNFGNPSFPFTMAAYSAGSTTNLRVSVASIAGFIEGDQKLHGPRMGYSGTHANVSTVLDPLFTIRNTRYYGNRSNQSVINLLSITASQDHTKPTLIYVIKNATLTGTPNFSQYSPSSVTYFDTAATGCTYTDRSQLIFTASLGDTGDLQFAFSDSITLQPGESLTVAAAAITGTAANVLVSLNTREDQ